MICSLRMKKTLTDFVTLKYLKNSLDIEDEDDNNDFKLIEVATDANNEISLKIKKYAETTPIEAGTPVFEEVRRVGTIYARSLWFESIFQHDQAKNTMERYKQAVETLEESLKLEPTSRADPFGIEVTDFESERKTPYSQHGYGAAEEHLL